MFSSFIVTRSLKQFYRGFGISKTLKVNIEREPRTEFAALSLAPARCIKRRQTVAVDRKVQQEEIMPQVEDPALAVIGSPEAFEASFVRPAGRRHTMCLADLKSKDFLSTELPQMPLRRVIPNAASNVNAENIDPIASTSTPTRANREVPVLLPIRNTNGVPNLGLDPYGFVKYWKERTTPKKGIPEPE